MTKYIIQVSKRRVINVSNICQQDQQTANTSTIPSVHQDKLHCEEHKWHSSFTLKLNKCRPGEYK